MYLMPEIATMRESSWDKIKDSIYGRKTAGKIIYNFKKETERNSYDF